MTPVVRISDATWERLQAWAVPLEDTPDDAVRKVLDIAEAHRNYSSPDHLPHSSLDSRLHTDPDPADEHRKSLAQDTAKVANTVKGSRLPKGTKVPNKAYEFPILETLYELEGRGRMNAVLEGVERKMRHLFTDVDYQTLSSGGDMRWRNTAQWARNTLVHQRGLLKKDSRQGIWELTERGIAEVERRRRR